MKQLTDDTWHLQRIETGPNKVPTSHLYLHGHKTAEVLKGAYLEACIQIGSRYLAFLTHDCPFEEGLSIYLLDAKLKPLDGIDMGAMYSSPHFEKLRLCPPDQVSFEFLGRYQWTLQINDQPQWRLPFFSDPYGCGRIRHGQFAYYMNIRKQPLPMELCASPISKPLPQTSTSQLYYPGSPGVDDQKTPCILAGTRLEACILVDIYYLMIFSDPTIASSTLYLHLLDIDYSLPLRETVRIDSTDSAAQFHSLRFQEPHSIHFHYGLNTTYTVHISGRMKFSLAHYGRTDGIQQTNPYYLSITKQDAISEKSK